MRHVTKCSPAKTGEFPRIFSNFQFFTAFIWGENMLGYLSLDTISSVSRSSQFLGTDKAREQISQHIFAPNGGYCLCSLKCQSSRLKAKDDKQFRPTFHHSRRPKGSQSGERNIFESLLLDVNFRSKISGGPASWPPRTLQLYSSYMFLATSRSPESSEVAKLILEPAV